MIDNVMQTRLTCETLRELVAETAAYTKRIHEIIAPSKDANLMFEMALGYALGVLVSCLNANPHTLDLINSALANDGYALVRTENPRAETKGRMRDDEQADVIQ